MPIKSDRTGDFDTFSAPPTPEEIIARMGVSIDWNLGKASFAASYHVDQVARKTVRPYQDMAVAQTLWHFAQGNPRALLLMATGTGKTFTVLQLIWKMMNGGALKRQHVLFLGSDSLAALLDVARREALDRMVVINLSPKLIGLQRRRDVLMTVRLIDVASGQSQWASPQLRASQMIAAVQAGGVIFNLKRGDAPTAVLEAFAARWGSRGARSGTPSSTTSGPGRRSPTAAPGPA